MAHTITLILENDEPTTAAPDQDTALAHLESKYALNPSELDDLARGESCLIYTHGDIELTITTLPLLEKRP